MRRGLKPVLWVLGSSHSDGLLDHLARGVQPPLQSGTGTAAAGSSSGAGAQCVPGAVAVRPSAAPTFFAAHSTEHLTDLVDGGLYANNPALLGVVGAFRFGRPNRRGIAPPYDLGATCLEQLAVLSVGTGEQCAMPYDPDRLRTGGRLAWGVHFHSVVNESQSRYIHLLAPCLLGAAHHRINPHLDFPMAMDEVRRLPALKNLAELSELDEKFLRTRIAAS